MRITETRLRQLVSDIFKAAGSDFPEHERISHYLVEANLAGHDSHGVIRIPMYINWVRKGQLLPNQKLKTVLDHGAMAIVDGQAGFGQVMGEEAMKLGIDKANQHGLAIIALRNAGHLGQIGAWALMATRANKISLHFVNTSGHGILVAPFGGINRRLSANPVAAGVPVKDGPPIILDISTCTIAEGKVRVALNKGISVPDNCLIDAEGQPTNDPKAFYASPPGAILPFGGHKGYGLSIIAEMLAGALTGGSCSNPKADRMVNNMLTILVDPMILQTESEFFEEINRFIAYVKSSKTTGPNGEILMPGEVEYRTRRQRSRDGIDLDETTWKQIQEMCDSLKVGWA